ncbi:MAG: hypothetical protein DWI04_00905 [Planctomycetota bacterium]|nr:MAG: hypothetical protein DWI04_00905 [Planctomycetota bacterium]
MKRRADARETQRCGKPPCGDLAKAAKHERPGEHFRLASPDHPLTRRRRVAKGEGERARCDDMSPAGREEGCGRMPKTNRQQHPSGDAANPCGLLERHGRGDRAGDQVEDAVGVGSLKEKVAAAPQRISGVPCLRQVDGLVDIGRGPRPCGCEDRRDQKTFSGTTSPARRAVTAAFTRRAVHL